MALKFLNDGYFAGKVGIGIQSPTVPLDVSGVIKTTTSFVGNAVIINQVTAATSSGRILFKNNSGSDKMAMEDNGNFGIGTVSPGEKLEVNGNIKVIESGQTPDVSVFHSDGSYAKLRGQGLFLSRATSYVAPVADNFGSLAVGYNGARWGNVEINAATVKFENGTNEFMRISSSGNVGIGTTSPSYKLHVKGTVNGNVNIAVENASTGTNAYASYRFKNNSISTAVMFLNGSNNSGYAGASSLNMYQGTNLPLGFVTNNLLRMTVTGAGNVGIGTNNPVEKLQINSGDILINNSTVSTLKSGGSLYIDLNTFGSYSGRNFRISDNGTSLVNVTQVGNVGIGTTSPSQKLHVVGNQYLDGDLDIKSPGVGNSITVLQSTSGNAVVNIGESAVGHGFLSLFELGVGDVIKFDANANSFINRGNVGIGTNSPSRNLEVSGVGTGDHTYIKILGDTAKEAILELHADNNASGDRWRIASGNSARLDFRNNGSTKVSFQGGGNVGIGTTAPSQKLHVVGNARVTGAYYDSNNSPGTANQVLVSTATGTDWVDASGSSIIGGPYLPLTAGSTKPLSGNLHFSAAASYMFGGDDEILAGQDGSGYYYATGNGQDLTKPVFIGDNNAYIRFKSGNSERMRITNTGNVGIGTTSPAYKLHVDGQVKIQSTNYEMLYLHQADANGGFIKFTNTDDTSGWYTGIAGTEKFIISRTADNSSPIITAQQNGDVGIGTDSPLGKLQINEYTVASQGNQNVHGELSVFANSGAESLFLGVKNAAYPNRGWAFNPVTSGVNSDLQIKEHGASGVRMTIKSGGNVGIGTTLPTANLHVQGSSATDAPIVRVGGFGNSGSTLELAETLTSGNMTYGFSFEQTGNGTNELLIKRHNNSAGGASVITLSRTNNNVSMSGGLSLALKATSSSTLSTDGGTTLTTKNYVDALTPGAGVFLPLAGGTMTAGAVVTFLDSSGSTDDRLKFGTGGDMQLFHDGTASHIVSSGSDLRIDVPNFIVRSSSGTENIIRASQNAAVELYYNNTKKFETTSAGVTVTGDVIIDDGVGRLTLDSVSGANRILSTTTGFGTYELLELRAEAYEFKIGTTEKFSIDSSGNATFAGNVTATNILTVAGAATGNPYLQFTQGGSQKAYIQYVDSGDSFELQSDNQFVVRTGGSTVALTINSSQNATFAGSVTIPNYIIHDSDPNTFFGFDNNDQVAIKTSGNYNFFGDSTATTLYAAGGAKLKTTHVSVGTATTAGGTLIDGWKTTTQANAINDTTIATTAYVNNKIALIPAGLVFQGTWNAASNSPTLTSGSGTTGNFYIVSTPGNTNLDGITDWKVGDWAVFIEQGASDQWEKIDNSSVLDGIGTGGSVAGWAGSGTSNTLTNAPITFSGNNTTFAGGLISANSGGYFRIQNAAGNSTYPTYSFQDDGNTGMMSSSTDSLSFVTGGTTRLLLNNVNATFAGDVTVNGSHLTLANGTTSAAATDYLYIGGDGLASADAAIYIGNGGGNTVDGYGYRIYYNGAGSGNNNKLIFKSENYQSAEIDMLTFTADGKSTFSQDATFAGNVGIGTTSPTDKLAVNGNLSIFGNKIYNGSASNSAGVSFPSSTTRIDGYNGITFHSSTTTVGSQGERMRITNAGNVGIGTTTPAKRLHISASDQSLSRIRISNTNTGSGGDNIDLIAGINNVAQDGFSIFNATSNQTQLVILGSGNVGIGTTSPNAKLQVGGDLHVYDEEGNTDARVMLSTGTSNVTTVKIASNGSSFFNAGDIGIGTTSPSYKLTVSGGGIQAGGKVTYTKSAGSLNTTGYAVAGLTTSSNGQSAGFTFTCFGHTGGYQKIVYSCYNGSGTWVTKKVINEGTNQLDVVASANGTTITFTFKSISGTMSYTPRVTVEAVGTAINSTYA